MKLHKYISGALLAGALSISANAALAGDDDMLTDFKARDEMAASMQNDWLQAQADDESFNGGPFDVALTYCSTTTIVDEGTGEIIAVYGVCDDIPDADVG